MVSFESNGPGADAEIDAASADLAGLRLLLSGESAVDMPRLWFRDRASVDGFIRVCGFDTDNPIDIAALRQIHAQAVNYLTETHHYRLPTNIEDITDVHEIFLAASLSNGRTRRYACMLLKVMHIIHHVQGRELVFTTPLSEAQLLERLSARVFSTIDTMRAAGIAVQEFAAGQKTRSSLVTKLLAKRTTLASSIFDKLRFRIVVATPDDIVRSLLYMLRNLFPFNYVIPEQSQNGILSIHDIARVLEVSDSVVRNHWQLYATERADGPETNEFSGKGFRSVNFVADIPLRIDDVTSGQTPAIVFVQTEIQLTDAETERNNNRGDNNHALYKKRQLERVKKRLEGDRPQGLDGPDTGVHPSPLISLPKKK